MTALFRRHYLLARVALVSFLAVASTIWAGASLAPVAQAQAYRYWSYWHVAEGQWTLATQGPKSFKPSDGAVEGWRFTKSGGTGAESKAAKPRGSHSFEQICGTTTAKEGTKRVAVVIDFGTQSAAPADAVPPVSRAACAQVPADASGAEVLAKVAAERYATSGLVCSIDGYPEGACGPGGGSTLSADGEGNADTSGSSDNASDAGTASDGGLPLGTVLGVAGGGLLVGLLGGAAVLRARKAR